MQGGNYSALIKKQERLGQVSNDVYGGKMEIIEYVNHGDITVRFDNGYTTKTRYNEFKKGEVKNPYSKTLCGIGFQGEGNYVPTINKRKTKQYNSWFGMMHRCYNPKTHIIKPTYKDCTVCEEWHNFQTFAKWYDENYYEVSDEAMNLDKDILIKGNKVYSPETCVFVPHNINCLFTKHDAKRGDYPIGVYWSESKNTFISQCSDGFGVHIILGKYDTIVEAFLEYKAGKEKIIKQIADEYKMYIPEKLYNALYKYQVEITD